ncbi:GNAT family N-acetyltransferase [Teichococcus vastitatis]|uniref:GNAT family N-acetyltransferase n=1 Tax=Teichococcus vastitatis TaxID=2307076 RepID=A0ABS9WD49_9PROT|nr:GNAT family N-acetyltransferase [Pseudoroseomonas vastitatis]MCI0756579.1 GNAT family N-acetyltransferase [Pseudoroseomonas vastitatis]
MIEELTAATLPAALPELAALLRACVDNGASIGFLPPLAEAEALAFWQGLCPAIAEGSRRLLVARRDGRILGTGSLCPAGLPNGRHRAEISKLMVHPAARRLGLGRALMRALEALAAREGRWLLVLDTLTGDAGETLYRGLGWQEAGQVPDYALLPRDGVLGTAATTVMFKRLAA